MLDLYAVFGNPIQHSYSPQIHLEFAKQENTRIAYKRILVPDDLFLQTLIQFTQNNGQGANITVPCKIEAFKVCQDHSYRALQAQAVNTLVKHPDSTPENPLWYGDNTDGIGLVNDIQRLGCTIKDKTILLIGAGGAARGVIQPLLDYQPKQFFIANRTIDKALHLSQFFDINAISIAETANINPDIIINSTSASLYNTALPLQTKIFQNAILAYDMVYASQDTPFIKLAKQSACPQTADGLGMLLYQAAESYFLWRHFRPNVEIVLKKIRELLHD